VWLTSADHAEVNISVEQAMQDFVGLEILECDSEPRMRFGKSRQTRQQEPLNQTLAGANDKFNGLSRARAPEFFQRALKWSPVSAIIDALDAAFYATFSNVEPCKQPVLLALDVSGSMAGSMIARSSISAREASAATVVITAATEPEHEIIAFSAPPGGGFGEMHGGGESGITRVNLSPRMRLAEVIKRIEGIPMGGYAIDQDCGAQQHLSLCRTRSRCECRLPDQFRWIVR
jgi:hypothetical protein